MTSVKISRAASSQIASDPACRRRHAPSRASGSMTGANSTLIAEHRGRGLQEALGACRRAAAHAIPQRAARTAPTSQLQQRHRDTHGGDSRAHEQRSRRRRSATTVTPAAAARPASAADPRRSRTMSTDDAEQCSARFASIMPARIVHVTRSTARLDDRHCRCADSLRAERRARRRRSRSIPSSCASTPTAPSCAWCRSRTAARRCASIRWRSRISRRSAPLLTAPGRVRSCTPRARISKCCCPRSAWCVPFSTRRSPRRSPAFPAQIGYGELVRRLLGVELAKAHTRTDWSRRPLSAEQLEYALDDVRYLAPLRAQLVRAAGAKRPRSPGSRKSSRRSPMPTRCASRPKMPGSGKGLPGSTPQRQRLAQALAAWRERRAIERNRPRGWILDDVACAKSCCACRARSRRWARSPEMQESVVRKCGEELLALVRDAGIPDPPPPLPRRERPDPALLALVKRLAEIAAGVATELEIEHGSARHAARARKARRGPPGRQPAARLARRRASASSCSSAL